jgi:hypothetical protein
VIRIEFPLDAKDLGITRNEFHLPNYFVVVKLKGEITREIKVLRHYPVPLFKATVARLASADANKLSVLFEKAKIPLNHMFLGNEEFEIYFPDPPVLELNTSEKKTYGDGNKFAMEDEVR